MVKMAAMRDGLRAELGAAYDAPVPGLDKADKGVGKATYEANCMSCHGGTGHGDGPAVGGHRVREKLSARGDLATLT